MTCVYDSNFQLLTTSMASRASRASIHPSIRATRALWP
jgi:hypothetical protein